MFANADSFTIPAGILTTTAVQATSYIFTLEVTREPAPPAADTETLRTKTVTTTVTVPVDPTAGD